MTTDAGVVLSMPDVRVLPPEDWDRLAEFHPFTEFGIPHPEYATIVVAEEQDEIVAFWCLFQTVHVEPMWIADAHRHRPGLIRRLWKTVTTVLADAGIPAAFAVILDENAQATLSPALRLGFKKVPGDLFVITPGKEKT